MEVENVFENVFTNADHGVSPVDAEGNSLYCNGCDSFILARGSVSLCLMCVAYARHVVDIPTDEEEDRHWRKQTQDHQLRQRCVELCNKILSIMVPLNSKMFHFGVINKDVKVQQIAEKFKLCAATGTFPPLVPLDEKIIKALESYLSYAEVSSTL